MNPRTAATRGCGLVEPLECRIAPASLATFTDTDGDIYTVKLSGPGTADVMQRIEGAGTGPIDAITFSGASAKSALSITVKRAAGGQVNIPLLTSIENVELFKDGAASQMQTAQFTDVDTFDIFARNGATLAFPGVTTLTGNLNRNTTIEASSASTLNGNLINTSGEVRTGNGIGTLTITGAYTQLAGGALFLEIAGLTPGTQHDLLSVGGPVTLGGTLALTVTGGFVPAIGNTFTTVTGSSVTGTFATVTGTSIGGGKTLTVTYNPASVVIGVI